MNHTEDKSFGHRLRKVFPGNSNKEIAHKLGVTNSAITYYMNGRIPSADMLIKISRITGCSIHWLITGEEYGQSCVSQDTEGHQTHTVMLVNVEGGAAKSISAAMLAVEFGRCGRRTLLVDTPSGDCTFILFHRLMRRHLWEDFPPGDLLTKRGVEGRIFFRTPYINLDLCSPGNRRQIILKKERVKSFRPDPSTINREYSIIVLDTASRIDPFATAEFFIASMVSSVHILIPTTGDSLSLGVLNLTLDKVWNIQKRGRNVTLAGAFLARHPYRNSELPEMFDELNKILPNKVLKTAVPHNTTLSVLRGDCIDHLIPPNSRGAAAYKSLAGEILASIDKAPG